MLSQLTLREHRATLTENTSNKIKSPKPHRVIHGATNPNALMNKI